MDSSFFAYVCCIPGANPVDLAGGPGAPRGPDTPGKARVVTPGTGRTRVLRDLKALRSLFGPHPQCRRRAGAQGAGAGLGGYTAGHQSAPVSHKTGTRGTPTAKGSLPCGRRDPPQCQMVLGLGIGHRPGHWDPW